MVLPYAAKKKVYDVISIIDYDGRQHIINLLGKDENTLTSMTKQIDLTNEAGHVIIDDASAVVQKLSKEDFWKNQMKKRQNRRTLLLLRST